MQNSLWMRFQFYFRLNGLIYDMLSLHHKCGFVKWKFHSRRTNVRVQITFDVCHPERSEAKSRDLRTDLPPKGIDGA